MIKNKKILFGLILLLLGFLGVLSLLTMEIPLSTGVKIMLEDKFTAFQIKLFTIINPTILLVVFIIIGTILYQKVNLTVPIIEKWIGIRKEKYNLLDILKYGVLGGILSGVLSSLVGIFFTPILPLEFIKLGESLKLTLWVRFLYGGITEEILLRFGLMTLIVWLTSKIYKETKSLIFWFGILITSIIFALVHFPIAYQALDSPNIGLLTYILIGNSIGGIVFGWLYWKKGLECAFIAHIFAHIIILFIELLLN